MAGGVFASWPRSVDDRELDRLLASQQDAPLTYHEVGASLAELPAGYRHGRHGMDLGTSRRAFGLAVEALRGWETHRGAGITVRPVGAPIREGVSVAQRIRLGPLTSVACCRIVEVVDEADRFGFAYGTLPLHPERGEEAFVVTRGDGGGTRLEITAFSRPAHPLVRLAGPLGRLTQAAVTRRYLRGVADYVRADH
jgi:uncharacterized protein (UPF0548 family)